MEKYLSAKQVAEILNVCLKTAYDVIEKMPHLQQPVRVSERIFKRYLDEHTVYPIQMKKGRKAG